MACLPSLGPAGSKATNGSTDAAAAVSAHPPVQALYIAPTDPFPEVEEFVTTSTKEYHLDLMRYELAMRPALEAYLDDRKSVKAVFMGTRRTDPHSEFLEHFSPTDKGWPQFMRINPMIDWCYVDIWVVSCLLCCRLLRKVCKCQASSLLDQGGITGPNVYTDLS